VIDNPELLEKVEFNDVLRTSDTVDVCERPGKARIQIAAKLREQVK
jgi:hypothetical protein